MASGSAGKKMGTQIKERQKQVAGNLYCTGDECGKNKGHQRLKIL